MKKWLSGIVLCAFTIGAAQFALAQSQESSPLFDIAKRFAYFVLIEGESNEPMRYVYADQRQHVHLFEVKDGKSNLLWETVNLGGRATGLIVRDLDKDGKKEIVIAAANGRILIYDIERYDLLWENLQDRFTKISCLAAENIDRDPQDELIFVADSFLYIYDSVKKTIEWQSQREFTAEEILLSNVDDDDQLEIILNTGLIVDSRFYTVEFEAEQRFGDRISMLDTNGDNIPEVIGETADFTVRVFDIYAEREVW